MRIVHEIMVATSIISHVGFCQRNPLLSTYIIFYLGEGTTGAACYGHEDTPEEHRGCAK